jgi:predicted O-methyltransferase YrrM
MITVQLMGGLGNQLSQVAFGYAFGKRNNLQFFLNEQKKNPHSNQDYTKTFFKKILKVNVKPTREFAETQVKQFSEYHFKDIKIEEGQIYSFYGSMQNEKYFIEFKDEIIKMFTPEVDEVLLKNKYKSLDKSYFLHIRRGDYLTTPKVNLDLSNYFKKCLKQIEGAHVYIFSDDPIWCSANIEYQNKTIVLENEVDSLWLMSKCKLGGICSNSSYSWWGSYLNINPEKKVYMPSEWLVKVPGENWDNYKLDIHPSYATVVNINPEVSQTKNSLLLPKSSEVGRITIEGNTDYHHEMAYKLAKEKEYKLVMIMEKDLIFHKEFENILEESLVKLNEIDPNWDMFMLNSMGFINWQEMGIRKAKEMYLRGCYVLSESGIKKYCENPKRNLQLDDHTYFYFPFLVIQKDFSFVYNWIVDIYKPKFEHLYDKWEKGDKILYVTYADKKFESVREQNLKDLDKKNVTIRSFSPVDLDEEFVKKNEKILVQKRGGGYWIWKPYIIVKALEEMTEDFLVYCDAGSKFSCPIQTIIDQAGEFGVVFTLPYYEKQWTKRDLFVELGLDQPEYFDTLQICATAMCLTKKAIPLIKDWLMYAETEHFIDDSKSVKENYPVFKEHRHDQSIFSLLCKKVGIKQLEMQKYVAHRFYIADLPKIGNKYGTDKVSHGFCDNYASFLENHRYDFTKIAEIGVFFGASILMWKEYFPNAIIYGLDAFKGDQGNGRHFEGYLDFWNKMEKNPDPRIKLVVMDQSKMEDLLTFREKDFDMILDDASHLMKDQQQTLGVLFPLIKPGGYFVIEDIHTSLQPDYDVEGDNSTLLMLQTYQKTGIWKSKYMTDDQMKYLKQNSGEVKIFKNNNYSMTCYIKKLEKQDNSFFKSFGEVKKVGQIGMENMNDLKNAFPNSKICILDTFETVEKIETLTSNYGFEYSFLEKKRKEDQKRFVVVENNFDILIGDLETIDILFACIKKDGYFIMKEQPPSTYTDVVYRNPYWCVKKNN